MNARSRFLNQMTFRSVDRVPRWEWAFRDDTTARWHQEGLPANVPDKVRWTEFFSLDEGGGYANGSMAEKVGVSVEPMPGLADEVLKEDERTVTHRNHWGVIMKSSKVGESIAQYLSFPVQTRDDFRRLATQWNPADPARYPADWEARKATWRQRNYPVSIWTYGWYGLLREIMGVEQLSIAFHEDTALVEEMAEFWGDFLISVFDRALSEVDVDYVLFWEDLAFKNGPLLSPAHFRRFFLPHYSRVIDRFRQKGMNLFMVDSDGNVESILPLWLEAGVNVVAPFEVAAGMDVVEVRRRYGSDLAIVGGIDKMEIARGPAAIKTELDRRVRPLLDQGGYIPTLDHAPIPEISFHDYRQYRNLLNNMCGNSGGRQEGRA